MTSKALAWALLVASATAATEYVDGSKIEQALAYPANKLVGEDWTDRVRAKTPNVISSFLYRGEGSTFGQLAVVVADKGSLLTADFEAQIVESVKETEARGGISPIRPLNLKPDGRGYAGLGAFGPGGSQSDVVISLDNPPVDFRISLTISGTTPIVPIEGASGFYELLQGDELGLRLEGLALTVADTIRARGITASLAAPSKDPSPVPIVADSNIERGTEPGSGGAKSSSPVEVGTDVPPESVANGLFWSILALIGIVIVIIGFLVCRCQRGRS